MGIINMGAPTDLVLALAREGRIGTFVETGTFLGGTAVWASRFFERVYTIENARDLYDRAVATYGHVENVRFLFGRTVERLPEVVSELDAPAVFWLDAHWSGGETYGAEEECPLLEEIGAVNASPHEHVILIDDARLFTSPPPPPHKTEEWPDVGTVFDALNADPHPRYTLIEDDAIISVPERMREALIAFYRSRVEEAHRYTAHSRVERTALLTARKLRSILP